MITSNELTDDQLNEKLNAWVREYGPGGMHIGGSGNILAVLIDHKGFVPNSSSCFGNAKSVADEVEDAVNAMAQTPGLPGDSNKCFRYAMALRAHLLTPKDWPEEERLHRLKLIGLPMSRATFFRYVRKARAFLIGYFNAMRTEFKEAELA